MSVPVTLDVLARVDALVKAAPPGERPDKATLLSHAIELGLSEMEHAPPDVGRGESSMVYQREGHLSFGTRSTEEDRRVEPRGPVGRRDDDRRQARKAFVERVLRLVDQGHEYGDIAQQLNDEGVTTSRGQPWSGVAIKQVVRTEKAKRARQAWSPKSLKGS